MRLGVSSDLHFDRRGHLTTPAAVSGVAARLRAERPDVVVLAGDIAHGLDNIRGGLEAFEGSAPVVAALAGNHDVWRDEARGLGSRQLLDEALPALCAELGVSWLETAVIRHGAPAATTASRSARCSRCEPRAADTSPGADASTGDRPRSGGGRSWPERAALA